MDIRRLCIYGDIDTEAFGKFSRQLCKLERTCKLNTIIDISLVSDGGSAYAALAFYDRIMCSSMKIHVNASGLVASAATLILAAGVVRRMTKNSWVMVHEDTTDVTKTMMVSQAEAALEHNREMETQWNKLLEERTGTSAEIWDELNKAETYMTAEDCMKLGLIQEIL